MLVHAGLMDCCPDGGVDSGLGGWGGGEVGNGLGAEEG